MRDRIAHANECAGCRIDDNRIEARLARLLVFPPGATSSPDSGEPDSRQGGRGFVISEHQEDVLINSRESVRARGTSAIDDITHHLHVSFRKDLLEQQSKTQVLLLVD